MSLAFRPTGPFTPPALNPTLQSFIGYWPSQLNGFAPGWKTDGNTVYGISQKISQWNTNTHVTVTDNAAQSVDGQLCASKVVPDTTSNWHIISDGLGYNTPASPHIQRFAIIARPDGYSRLNIQTANFGVSNTNWSTVIDFAGPNIGFNTTFGSALTVVQQQVVALTGGWVLAYIDHYLNNASVYADGGVLTFFPVIRVDNSTGTTGGDHTIFTGDGTSGIDVLMMSVLPVCLWNNTFNSPGGPTLFADEFNSLSTIDLNDTRAPGFKWYIHNLFPNSVYSSFGWATNPPSAPTPTVDITQPMNSVMRMWQANNQLSNSLFSGQLWSVATDGGNGFVGTVCPTPHIRDTYVAWNATVAQVTNSAWNGDGSGGFCVPVGALLPSGTPNSINELNNSLYAEWDWGVSPPGNDNTAQNNPTNRYYRETGAVGFTLINKSAPSGVVGSAYQTGGVYSNVQSLDFHRLTNIWVSSFTEPTAQGYGVFYTYSDGGALPNVNAQAVRTYARNSYAGQSEFYNYTTFLTERGITFGAPEGLFGQATGSQQFYMDWYRVYGAVNPVQCYNSWDAYDSQAYNTSSLLTIDNTALIVTKSSGGTVWTSVRGSGIGKKAGLWYWELTLTGTVATSTSVMLGVMNTAATVTNSNPGATSKGAGIASTVASNTNVSGVTGKTASSLTFAANDVISFALDMTAGIVYIAQNNVWLNGAPGSGNGVWGGLTNADRWYPAVAIHDTSGSPTITANFGGSAFVYGLPSGYTGWTLPP